MTDQTAAIEVWARVLCAADAHVHGYPTWQQLPTAPGPSGRSQDDYRKVAAWLLPRMTVADPAGQAPDTEERAARWETAALKAGREVDRNALRVYMAVADDEQAELRRMAVEAQQPSLAVEDCTCIPFTRQGGVQRYCQPGDTVDMISGWEIGGDCPHHRYAVKAQQPKEARS